MRCPGCATEVDPAQDFCLECGEPIAQAAVVDVESLAPPPARAPSAAPPARTPSAAAPARPPVRRPRRDDEPEPIRCPGCGTPERGVRCRGCGIRLRADD